MIGRPVGRTFAVESSAIVSVLNSLALLYETSTGVSIYIRQTWENSFFCFDFSVHLVSPLADVLGAGGLQAPYLYPASI